MLHDFFSVCEHRLARLRTFVRSLACFRHAPLFCILGIALNLAQRFMTSNLHDLERGAAGFCKATARK
jgi:hypothetical protein